jgi:N-methylhydantoinase A/oxoprolinase/acetone carboxylase beta subunit
MRDLDAELYDALLGDRIGQVDPESIEGAADDALRLVSVISTLTSSGADRLVVCFDGPRADDYEKRFKRLALAHYPRHLLGAVPILFAHELTNDFVPERRAWTAVINAFLHPAMEEFLYTSEDRLRGYRTRNPLLIFRNDGHASCVAKTVAIKSYSSGPRGGLEGARTLARLYGFGDLVSMDIGGTTTDIGRVAGNEVFERAKGEVEGVPIAFPLCEIASSGFAGSSIFRIEDGVLRVGPDSVGAVPGPGCFGRGGQEATMTDACLLIGILDPATYFGGGLALDRERARAVIESNVANALSMALEEALLIMRRAYEGNIGAELRRFAGSVDDTTLLVFGGAGPMSACGIAETAGFRTVVVPKMAAVFSAWGIGSCDVGQRYLTTLHDRTADALRAVRGALTLRAERDLFAEGFGPEEYDVRVRLLAEVGATDVCYELADEHAFPPDLLSAEHVELELTAVKTLRDEITAHGEVEKLSEAVPAGLRRVLQRDSGWREVPLYEFAALPSGAYGIGPAIIEERYFTCVVGDGWEFCISGPGDIFMRQRGSR